MDEWLPTIMKAAMIVLGGAVTLAITMLGLYLRKLSAEINRVRITQDLLFKKLDKQARELHKVQLAIVAKDPSQTAIFSAFMVKTDDE